jgi:hypothetical protein
MFVPGSTFQPSIMLQVRAKPMDGISWALLWDRLLYFDSSGIGTWKYYTRLEGQKTQLFGPLDIYEEKRFVDTAPVVVFTTINFLRNV